MLSCQHQPGDDRIYWKEALSLKKAGYTVVHIAVGAEKKDYLSAEGIRLIQLTRKKYFSNAYIDKFFRLISFRKDVTADILSAAKAINADVYHLHDVQINKIGKRLKQLPQKPKVIYDVHESYGDLIRDHSPFLLKPLNYLYALYIERRELKNARRYDAIITTEEYVLSRFKKKAPGVPAVIVFNYSYFLPGPEAAKKKPKLYDAIYSGTISALRGMYEIVDAVRILKESRPAIKVMVIGYFASKKLKHHVLLLVKKYQLAGNLIIHDPVAFEDIGSFYDAAKTGLCIFHPARLHVNAVFIKTFEYMAFGLPVVGSNFGTTADYIHSANAGITVNPLDPAAIAHAILQLLDSPELYEKYSHNGRNAVREKYNWLQEESKLLSLYQTILSQPG
jgi:glycosyltransferase involved in cell wall biosynthesis